MKNILLTIATFLSVNLSAQTAETDKKCPCDYPTLDFTGKVVELNSITKQMLASAAHKLKEHPFCNIFITGYPTASKLSQRLCQIRLEVIKRHLIEIQGISSDRIITDCNVGAGDSRSIDIKCDN